MSNASPPGSQPGSPGEPAQQPPDTTDTAAAAADNWTWSRITDRRLLLRVLLAFAIGADRSCRVRRQR